MEENRSEENQPEKNQKIKISRKISEEDQNLEGKWGPDDELVICKRMCYCASCPRMGMIVCDSLVARQGRYQDIL